MLTKTSFCVLVLVLFQVTVNAQLQILKGVVIANEDVEGIHILNRTSVKYTVTDSDGAFQILAKTNDTLTISSLKYETKDVIITKASISSNNLTLFLTEKINQLDEVIVGKVLSGSLGNDMSSFGEKPDINFYDLGIPGYIGKPKTLPERKLYDADHGKMIYYYGLGASVNMNKLLNKISGRTKRLEENVILDENNKCQNKIKKLYSETLFKTKEWKQAVIVDYFYFCMEDERFNALCSRNNPTEILPFLREKLEVYKANLNSGRD